MPSARSIIVSEAGDHGSLARPRSIGIMRTPLLCRNATDWPWVTRSRVPFVRPRNQRERRLGEDGRRVAQRPSRHRGGEGSAASRWACGRQAPWPGQPSSWSSTEQDSAEYQLHQRQKLEEMLRTSGGFSHAVVAACRIKFYRRFRALRGILPRDAEIVCAGARQGTEVEVLRDLGFRRAYGIDLNPGPENPLVRSGDFMRLDVPDSAVDLFYSNYVDHAFDLQAFFAEHTRAIKPEGYVLYDLSVHQRYRDPFAAVTWESEKELLRIMRQHFGSTVRLEREQAWTWILLRGRAGS